MRIFGSLTNRIEERMKSPEPKVGMGATLYFFSDRYAGTIVEVSARAVVVQEDSAKLKAGSRMSEFQEYEFAPNEKGIKRVFTLRKTGSWVEKNSAHTHGLVAVFGERDQYVDPSF